MVRALPGTAGNPALSELRDRSVRPPAHIRFKARVTAARYDAAEYRWRVTTENGEHCVATFLITAVGCLSSANVPNIPGLDTFERTWYHTGQWPHDGVDFAGTTVGVIGTGSTAIQADPVIAAQAAHLTVFQRTANYSVPARNAPLTPRSSAGPSRTPPNSARSCVDPERSPVPDRRSLRARVGPDERRAIFEDAWESGGLRFRAAFRDILVDKAANDTAAEFIRAKIR